MLVNTATNFRYSTTTDATGRFAFELLPPGDYSGRVESPGMSPQTTPRLHVDVGGTTELDFKLAVAGAKETVTVSGEPPLVETQPSGLSSLIDERAINELPLNGRRYTDLALLTPGVTQDPRGLTSGSNGDLAFGGIRGFQSSYLVDGGDNNNAFFGQARGRYRAPYQFSNEVVQEFRVSSNTYGAELGRSGGAVVNVVTKSGSNRLHGTDFYYLRDSALGSHSIPSWISSLTISSSSSALLWAAPSGATARFSLLASISTSSTSRRWCALTTEARWWFPSPALDRRRRATTKPATRRWYSPPPRSFRSRPALFPSSMLGNAGFFKLDFVLNQHNNLSLRLNTSRYYGHNNVFLDPASPLTSFGISDNGEEDVSTESGSLTLTSNLSFRVVSRFQAQFSRDLQPSTANSTDPLTKIPDIIDGLRTLLHSSPPDPRAPPASGRNLQRGRQKKFLEVRRRRAAHLDLQLLSLAERRRVHLRSHQGKSRSPSNPWNPAWN